MKSPKEMTREELREFVEETVNSYFKNVIFMGVTPLYNPPCDVINQLNNYSRN